MKISSFADFLKCFKKNFITLVLLETLTKRKTVRKQGAFSTEVVKSTKKRKKESGLWREISKQFCLIFSSFDSQSSKPMEMSYFRVFVKFKIKSEKNVFF